MRNRIDAFSFDSTASKLSESHTLSCGRRAKNQLTSLYWQIRKFIDNMNISNHIDITSFAKYCFSRRVKDIFYNTQGKSSKNLCKNQSINKVK